MTMEMPTWTRIDRAEVREGDTVRASYTGTATRSGHGSLQLSGVNVPDGVTLERLARPDVTVTLTASARRALAAAYGRLPRDAAEELARELPADVRSAVAQG